MGIKSHIEIEMKHIVSLVHLLCWCLTLAEGTGLGCGKTARAFNNYGLAAYDIPREDIAGSHLQVCSAARTCCTEGMELQLSGLSRGKLDTAVGGTVQQVADRLGRQGHSFDHFFRGLMNDSRSSLDAMFKKTYGLLYEQNAHVFTDLFAELEDYYNTGARDLTDVMDEFFTVLYKRMFTVLNSQNTFDEQYLECVATHMEGLKPFRDVPAKLTLQLKRSFVATRTLVQSLRTGHDVAKRLQTVNMTPSCGSALMKMSQCSTCSGMPRVKACHGLCLNVMKGCLAHHSRLNDQWHQYIDGIINLVTRLEGPFNIESAVSPINVKISYAIMNFQDNGNDVSRKIFAECGDPKFRRKRQAGGDSPSYDASADFKRVQFRMYPDTNSEAAPSPLLRVLASVRSQVRPLKTFWYDMPSQLCNDREMAVPPARIMNCWNGTAKSRYSQPLMKNGIAAQVSNPEVPVDPLYTDSNVNEAILDLKRSAIRLRDAYNGQTVTWERPAERREPPGAAISPPELAGSGSGDGAGYDVDAELGPDDDDYYSEDYSLEGSGVGPSDDYDVSPPRRPDMASPPRRRPDADEAAERDNTIGFSPPDDTNTIAGGGSTSGAGRPAARERMSLARAITVLVCPTVVAWIGTFI